MRRIIPLLFRNSGTGATTNVGKKLYDLTLGSDGTFDTDTTPDEGSTSIASGYDWIEIAITRLQRDSASANINCYFNTDTTDANYQSGYHRGGTSEATGETSSPRIGVVTTTATGEFSEWLLRIYNYDQAQVHTCYSNGGWRNSANGYIEQAYMTWHAGAAAISRIRLQPTTSDFKSGARMIITGYNLDTP